MKIGKMIERNSEANLSNNKSIATKTHTVMRGADIYHVKSVPRCTPPDKLEIPSLFCLAEVSFFHSDQREIWGLSCEIMPRTFRYNKKSECPTFRKNVQLDSWELQDPCVPSKYTYTIGESHRSNIATLYSVNYFSIIPCNAIIKSGCKFVCCITRFFFLNRIFDECAS